MIPGTISKDEVKEGPQQSSSRIRIDRGAIIREKRREAEIEAADREEQKAKSALLGKEKHAVSRCVNFMTEACKDLKEDVFSIYPSIVPFILSSVEEDFDIPPQWKEWKAAAIKTSNESFERYRTLVKNSYKQPLQRGTCSVDDIPFCSCSPIEGCGSTCQNRLLFM